MFDFNIHERDFPENALVYVNQAYLSTKEGELIIYCQYVILGQIIALRNPPPEPEKEIAENDKLVKFYVPMYDNLNGNFFGVKETVGYIMVRGDHDQTFWTYGYDKKRSKLLYCFSKQPMPNVFKGTSFCCYGNQMLNEREGFSKIFLFLQSITDRREKINQYKDQVSLMPVDCKLEKFADYAREGYSFDPSHLSSGHPRLDDARETIYNFFANAAEVSNTNLIQNVYSLMKKRSLKHSDVKWGINMPQNKINDERFSLG